MTDTNNLVPRESAELQRRVFQKPNPIGWECTFARRPRRRF